MKKINLFLVFCLWTVLLSAQENKDYATLKKIVYYPEDDVKQDSYKAKMCILDFYYPINKTNFPTIVWFHGGGLTSGKREIPHYLKNKGFGVIGVEYRLSPKVHGATCIEDAAAAVAWAFKNVEEYGGSTDLIFVSGMSAGGYLTYMVGLNPNYLSKYQIDANKIAGLIPFSGHAITHFTIRKERGIPGTQPVIDSLAPLHFIKADTPPLLIITGDRELEMLGRYEENAYMMRMLKVAGNKQVKLYELDGSNHGQMMYPALPLLAREVKALTKKIKKQTKE